MRDATPAHEFTALQELPQPTGRMFHSLPAINIQSLVACGVIPNPLMRSVVRLLLRYDDEAGAAILGGEIAPLDDERRIDQEIEEYRARCAIVAAYIQRPKLIMEGVANPDAGEVHISTLHPSEITHSYKAALGGLRAATSFPVSSDPAELGPDGAALRDDPEPAPED